MAGQAGFDTTGLLRLRRPPAAAAGDGRLRRCERRRPLGGAATGCSSPASSGLVPELVAANQLQQANALMSISRYVSFPFGAALGGAIVATIGSGTALLVDAGTYAEGALLPAAIRVPARARPASAPNFAR